MHDGLYVVFYKSRVVITPTSNGSVEHTPLHVDGVSGVLAPPLGRKAPLRSEPGRSTEPWLHLRHIRAHGVNSYYGNWKKIHLSFIFLIYLSFSVISYDFQWLNENRLDPSFRKGQYFPSEAALIYTKCTVSNVTSSASVNMATDLYSLVSL